MPQERRHTAFATQRMAMNLGLGLGSMTGGLIATTARPGTFTVLFLIDAATFLVLVGVLGLVPEPPAPPRERDAPRASFRLVLRDHAFVGLIGLNVLFVAAGYAQFGLLPVFAKNVSGVSEAGIGAVFLVNTLVVVLAQLPVSKLLEGRRRMRALAAMTVIWAASWLLVLAGGAWLEAAGAAVLFAVAASGFAVGECFQGPTQAALVADLATPHLSGRYFSLSAMSWGLGNVIGPAAGGFVLAAQPLALWPLAALVCVCAGGGALLLERRVPGAFRHTPAGPRKGALSRPTG